MLVGVTLAGATVLAACGGGGGGGPQTALSGGAGTHPTAATVSVRHTSLGDVLVDARGRTLYAFAGDTGGTSTCTGTCATTWPPYTVTKTVTAGKGLDATTLHTVMTAGATQVVAGRWPLYHFVGDTAAGDVTGQGVERFFVVRPDGSMVGATATTSPAPTSARSRVAPVGSGPGY